MCGSSYHWNMGSIAFCVEIGHLDSWTPMAVQGLAGRCLRNPAERQVLVKVRLTLSGTTLPRRAAEALKDVIDGPEPEYCATSC